MKRRRPCPTCSHHAGTTLILETVAEKARSVVKEGFEDESERGVPMFVVPVEQADDLSLALDSLKLWTATLENP